jgi:hypothetical protein
VRCGDEPNASGIQHVRSALTTGTARCTIIDYNGTRPRRSRQQTGVNFDCAAWDQ